MEGIPSFVKYIITQYDPVVNQIAKGGQRGMLWRGLYRLTDLDYITLFIYVPTGIFESSQRIIAMLN